MNFDLNEDEEMLKAVAERFVTDRYSGDRDKAARANRHGYCRDNWRLLGELGLISAPFSGDNGGLGIDLTGIAIIFEALGNGLVVEPLIENVVLAGGLFERVATEPARSRWMAAFSAGEKRIALAHREEQARYNPNWVETSAQRDGDRMVLAGSKSLVAAGGGVDVFIVSARLSGEAGDPEGVGLFLVEPHTAGVSVEGWHLADGSSAVSLRMDDVAVAADACLAGGLAEIDVAQTRATVARVAEAIGIMERLFADTSTHLRTRTQFGVALGSFQALQHRMVAQYAAIEQARALLNLAIMTDPNDPRIQRKAALGARAFVAKASVELGHEMIQFHGGMGVTDELAIGRGHKRLLTLSRWPDDPQAALDAFAEASTFY